MIYCKFALPYLKYTKGESVFVTQGTETVKDFFDQIYKVYPSLKTVLKKRIKTTNYKGILVNNKQIKTFVTKIKDNDLITIKSLEKKCLDVYLHVDKADHIHHTHFYHFFLGCLFPVIFWHNTIGNDISVKKIFLRSCGYLDKIIKYVKLSNITILDQKEYDDLYKKQRVSDSVYKMVIGGWDTFKVVNDYLAYPIENIRYVASFLKEKLHKDIEVESKTLPDAGYILMIQRGDPNTTSTTSGEDKLRAGSLRRTIPNFNNLVTKVMQKYKVFPVTLENKSLAWQIAAFSRAKMVVAQHGAGLSNIVFCPPNTNIIEILPKNMLEANSKVSIIFRSLAKHLEFNYTYMKQEGRYKKVDGDELLKHIDSVFEKLVNSEASTNLV
jgi:Glycosyltransferase 61